MWKQQFVVEPERFRERDVFDAGGSR